MLISPILLPFSFISIGEHIIHIETIQIYLNFLIKFQCVCLFIKPSFKNTFTVWKLDNV